MNELVLVTDLFVPMDTLPEHLKQMVRDARAVGEDIHFSTIKGKMEHSL